MKSIILVCLLLAFTTSCGFSSTTTSTLAQRAKMMRDAEFEKNPEDAIKKINEKQQSGEVKADDQAYVVVIQKQPDGSYKRVAHAKEAKVNQPIEPVLTAVMTAAEEKLAGGKGPVDFEFSAGDKKLYAIVEKSGDYLAFNICPMKDEVDGYLKAKSDDGAKSAESVSAPAQTPAPASGTADAKPSTEIASKEVKTEEKPIEKAAEKPTSIISALGSASMSSSSTEEKISAPASVATSAEVKPSSDASPKEVKTEEKPAAESAEQKVHS